MNKPAIIVTGGGSGGHIMPILAVSAEIKQQQPDAHIVYVGQIGDGLVDLPTKDPNIDEVYFVRAGKFRRYHGEGLRQLLDVKTVALNLRDLFYIGLGFVQSVRLLHRLKPQVVFTRGGYVSVPVALGGRVLGVPYITHDSDSTPSLANRLIARWANAHAVALPAEVYPYPSDKTVVVGVPANAAYQPVSATQQHRFKHVTKLDRAKQVVLVTGGGNGARQLNTAVIDNSRALLKKYPELYIVHLSGRALELEVNDGYDTVLDKTARKRVVVHGFVTNQHEYSGAADVIIARGGATTLAEFALQAKACVIVPSKQLIWNVKNTEAYEARHAVVKLDEDQAEQELRLAHVISDLLDNDAKRQRLGAELAKLGHPNAAKDLAMLVLKQIA